MQMQPQMTGFPQQQMQPQMTGFPGQQQQQQQQPMFQQATGMPQQQQQFGQQNGFMRQVSLDSPEGSRPSRADPRLDSTRSPFAVLDTVILAHHRRTVIFSPPFPRALIVSLPSSYNTPFSAPSPQLAFPVRPGPCCHGVSSHSPQQKQIVSESESSEKRRRSRPLSLRFYAPAELAETFSPRGTTRGQRDSE